jgi:hypothetical protein
VLNVDYKPVLPSATWARSPSPTGGGRAGQATDDSFLAVPPSVVRPPDPLTPLGASSPWLGSVAAEQEPGHGSRSRSRGAHGAGAGVPRAHAHLGAGRRLPRHRLRLPHRRALPPPPRQGPLRSLFLTNVF